MRLRLIAGVVVLASLLGGASAQADPDYVGSCIGASCSGTTVPETTLDAVQAVVGVACGATGSGVAAPPLRVCTLPGSCSNIRDVVQLDGVAGIQVGHIGCSTASDTLIVRLAPPPSP